MSWRGHLRLHWLFIEFVEEGVVFSQPDIGTGDWWPLSRCLTCEKRDVCQSDIFKFQFNYLGKEKFPIPCQTEVSDCLYREDGRCREATLLERVIVIVIEMSDCLYREDGRCRGATLLERVIVWWDLQFSSQPSQSLILSLSLALNLFSVSFQRSHFSVIQQLQLVLWSHLRPSWLGMVILVLIGIADVLTRPSLPSLALHRICGTGCCLLPTRPWGRGLVDICQDVLTCKKGCLSNWYFFQFNYLDLQELLVPWRCPLLPSGGLCPPLRMSWQGHLCLHWLFVEFVEQGVVFSQPDLGAGDWWPLSRCLTCKKRCLSKWYF